MVDAVTTTAAALATQHVRLYKALGGGWTPETEMDATVTGRRDAR